MKKVVAYHFDNPDSAQEALDRLEKASAADQITLMDALTISWSEGQRGPRTRRPLHLTLVGKGVESVQRVVMAVLYLLIALSSTTLFLARVLLKHGIHPDFVATVREQIAPGTSILVLMADEKTSAAIEKLTVDLAPAEIGSNQFTNEEKGSVE